MWLSLIYTNMYALVQLLIAAVSCNITHTIMIKLYCRGNYMYTIGGFKQSLLTTPTINHILRFPCKHLVLLQHENTFGV